MTRWQVVTLYRANNLLSGESVGSEHVLQEQARSYRRLKTLEIDPERLRPVVLATMAGLDRPPPTWPDEVSLGLLSRLFRRLFARTNITN